MINKDYAYFKLKFFDFPVRDSLVKICGNEIPIFIRISAYINNTAPPQFIPGGGAIIPDTITTFINNSTAATLSLTNVKSFYDIAELIKQKLIDFSTDGVRKMDTLSLANEFDNTNLHFFNWFDDIMYDPATGKYAIVFSKPTNYVPVNTDEPDYQRITRFRLEIYGEQRQKAGKLLASIFGGEEVQDGWKVAFDTEITNFFLNQTDTMVTTIPVVQERAKAIHNMSSLYVYSPNVPKLYLDPYVYIRGTPESAMWNTDGTTSDVLAIQPRTRQNGNTVGPGAYIADQTLPTKTSLNSLRHMTLRFTDSEGDLLQVDDDYLIKLAIIFDI